MRRLLRLPFALLLLPLLLLPGCIWMETVEVSLDPAAGTGHLVYQDIKSSPSHGDQDWTSVQIKRDFKRYHKAYKSNHLADMPAGVQVTGKALYEKREQLWAEYDIKYQTLEGLLGFHLVDGLYRVEKSPEIIAHNGEELADGDAIYLTWPQDTKAIRLTLDYNFQHPNTRSLVKDYRKKLGKRAQVRE